MDELSGLFDGDVYSDADTFRARLTASRLAHPQTDNLYALYAARIKQIPFQYKPLLRLLRADRPRLLIADEVGVGKTIEAGLILKELQARQRLDNVIIICPKALVTKWRAEMRRFDEDFHILNSEMLRNCLRETHLDGAWPIQHARSIIPLEVIRKEEYLSGIPGPPKRYGLLELDPPPRFDLLVVDEAHHVRTPETHSHSVVRFLADESEAADFLSATPVHIGSQNLFALLNLLRPDLFPDHAVFEEMVAPNRHIPQGMRFLRTQGVGWAENAGDALAAAANTPWGAVALAADTRFSVWAPLL
ncbi:MAG: DEAD/DEAH box helicase family protein, partial [Propionibacteriaceae bacterium]|nr:DEAD/DEAH box helicase family protein [Propionibacteriaceae bacterium]